MNEYEKKFKDVTGKIFTLYYKEFSPKITYYLTKKYTKDEDKSKEYVQRAFMQSLEKIDTYNPNLSALHTWITKIAINLVLKDWKDTQKVEIVSVDAEIQDTPGFINIIRDDTGNAENEIYEDNVKKCEIILETIKNLPEKYKKVMLMREVQKMHYKDIADSIRKIETKTINNDTYKLTTPEDFFQLDLENTGNDIIKIQFFEGNRNDDDGEIIYTEKYVRIIKPHHSYFIVREEFDWDRSFFDKFLIISENSTCEITYVTTTNLSTIKSQIKKGRSLIRKKVKSKFNSLGFVFPSVDVLKSRGIDEDEE